MKFYISYTLNNGFTMGKVVFADSFDLLVVDMRKLSGNPLVTEAGCWSFENKGDIPRFDPVSVCSGRTKKWFGLTFGV